MNVQTKLLVSTLLAAVVFVIAGFGYSVWSWCRPIASADVSTAFTGLTWLHQEQASLAGTIRRCDSNLVVAKQNSRATQILKKTRAKAINLQRRLKIAEKLTDSNLIDKEVNIVVSERGPTWETIFQAERLIASDTKKSPEHKQLVDKPFEFPRYESGSTNPVVITPKSKRPSTPWLPFASCSGITFGYLYYCQRRRRRQRPSPPQTIRRRLRQALGPRTAFVPRLSKNYSGYELEKAQAEVDSWSEL